MYAIIECGGKQYEVRVGDLVKVEKIDGEVGSKIELNALFVNDEGKIKTTKEASAVKVKAEVVSHGKGEKIIIFKYRSKKRTRSKNGHRQPYTEIKILEIK